MAFGSGLLFSAGLAIGGMTLPQKVIAFLDFTHDWDPSLALVMGGALAVYAPGYWLLRRRRQTPRLAPRFVVPTARPIDGSMLLGASLFGIGWGIAGFCPGPAITSVAGLAPDALVFAPAMLLGALFARWLMRRRANVGDEVEVCG
ncbi:MAG: YeeE/YedE family protein [Sandaracinaceae bacterium]|nr:YeeE/YedE family protein [Sandaracinaceae bacterium]